MATEKVRITVLVTNSVGLSFMLFAEHGLSFWIEKGENAVLFDTGQGRALFENAPFLGKDLRLLKKVALSHGHFDHTRGIKTVLEQAENNVEVYAHPAVFEHKYFRGLRKGQPVELFIGLPFPREDLKNAGAQLHLSTSFQELVHGLYITGEIPRRNDFEVPEEGFYVKEPGGSFREDSIPDDQAIVVEGEKGISVITGCAHAGVCNTLDHIANFTGTRSFYALIGGTHLVKKDIKRFEHTLEWLKKYNVQLFAPGHCTGWDALAFFSEHLEGKFVPLEVGATFDL